MSITNAEAIEKVTSGTGENLVTESWTLTQKLACACRVLADEGHGSGLAGQMTARGPEPDTMWTLPYGMGFEEVNASSYLLVDNNLDVIEGGDAPNPANRFHLHVYRARPDVHSIVHTHPLYSSALSMIGEPLHVAHMDTSMFYDDVAHLKHWPGIPFGDEEGEMISTALGDKNAILLAHHGQLCVGPTVDAACVMGIFFERAAHMQLLAQAAGTLQHIEPDLGHGAHEWRHNPKAMALTFAYFARCAIEKHADGFLS
jgi:L-fuculose-phosphate aldolase